MRYYFPSAGQTDRDSYETEYIGHSCHTAELCMKEFLANNPEVDAPLEARIALVEDVGPIKDYRTIWKLKMRRVSNYDAELLN